MKNFILPLFFLAVIALTGCQSNTTQPTSADNGLPTKDSTTVGTTNNPNVQGNFQEKPPAFQPPPTPQSISPY